LHLLGYLFAPVLACLMAGQTAAFLLVGVTAFLYLRRGRPIAAGAALAVCAIKPHLFGPFLVCILLWTIARREWRVPAGFALTVSCASVLRTLSLPRDARAPTGPERVAPRD
jgi:uncharacterized membrane protein